jgi:hypothetical protein
MKRRAAGAGHPPPDVYGASWTVMLPLLSRKFPKAKPVHPVGNEAGAGPRLLLKLM